jgi:hypothetical protein
MNQILHNCDMYNQEGADISVTAAEFVTKLHLIVRPNATYSSSSSSSSSLSVAPPSSSQLLNEDDIAGVDDFNEEHREAQGGKEGESERTDHEEGLKLRISNIRPRSGEEEEGDLKNTKRIRFSMSSTDPEDETNIKDGEDERERDTESALRLVISRGKIPNRNVLIELIDSSQKEEDLPSQLEGISVRGTRERKANKIYAEDPQELRRTGSSSRGIEMKGRRGSNRTAIKSHEESEEEDEDDGEESEREVLSPSRRRLARGAKIEEHVSSGSSGRGRIKNASKVQYAEVNSDDGEEDEEEEAEDEEESVVSEIQSTGTRRSGRESAGRNKHNEEEEEERHIAIKKESRSQSKSSAASAILDDTIVSRGRHGNVKQSNNRKLPPSKPTTISHKQEEVPKEEVYRLDSDTKKILNLLLIAIEEADKNGSFSFPVTEEEAPAYSEIVLHPMDLSTAR